MVLVRNLRLLLVKTVRVKVNFIIAIEALIRAIVTY